MRMCQWRILRKPTQSPRAKLLIPKIQRETHNSLLRDRILYLIRALANHSLCLKVKSLILKTQREINTPLIWNCLLLSLMKVLEKPSLYLRKKTRDKDLEINKPLTDIEPSTHPVTALSGDDVEDQADQTQSTGFEVSVFYRNKVETSFKVEPDSQPLLMFNDELVEDNDNDDDVFEAGDEMDEDIQ
ncbi:hypothetical protein Tco_0763371 [Tanacetum coccineum]